MKKKIAIYLFLLFLIPYVSIAQTKITINDGSSLNVTEGAQVCADEIIVHQGGSFVTYDESGTCEGADIIYILPPPEELIGDLISEINLLDNLNQGETNSLISKLDNVLDKLNKGSKKAAINQIGAFINEVEALVGSGRLTEEEGQELIDAADDVIESINILEKSVASDTEQTDVLPTEYSLEQNFPNPFNPSTVIKYELPKAVYVRLEVYNSIGQLVSLPVDDQMAAGIHETILNADNLPSGFYIYRIVAGEFVSTKRMIVLK